MKINKGLLNIGENLEELKDPQYIIIHHTEEEGWNFYDTNNYHISLGWEGHRTFVQTGK